MKLYTEEQVKEAYNRGHMDGRLNNTDYSITDGFTPIELPSDEEIRKRGWEDADAEDDIAFFVGAKWLKEQILNQNNKLWTK